jgi:hypothetical protein
MANIPVRPVPGESLYSECAYENKSVKDELYAHERKLWLRQKALLRFVLTSSRVRVHIWCFGRLAGWFDSGPGATRHDETRSRSLWTRCSSR